MLWAGSFTRGRCVVNGHGAGRVGKYDFHRTGLSAMGATASDLAALSASGDNGKGRRRRVLGSMCEAFVIAALFAYITGRCLDKALRAG